MVYLEGEDAERFLANMKKAESTPISKEERDRMEAAYSNMRMMIEKSMFPTIEDVKLHFGELTQNECEFAIKLLDFFKKNIKPF
jgi:hypothetical protein